MTFAGSNSQTISLTHILKDDLEPGTYGYSVSTLQEMGNAEITVETEGSSGPPAQVGIPDQANALDFAGILSWLRR